MHFAIYVTKTDESPVDAQLEPFWEETQEARYLEREIVCKGKLSEQIEYVKKHLKEDWQFEEREDLKERLEKALEKPNRKELCRLIAVC